MLSMIFDFIFGIFLFLGALVLIPRLLSGDKKIYEIAVPFGAILIISILFTNNLNLSLLISTVATGVIYYIRKRRT